MATYVVETLGPSLRSPSPLVVLLHGRGSDELGAITLAGALPRGATYAALRGPLRASPGYTWFENHSIGRPTEQSLREQVEWFRGWLDDVAPAGRQVVLIGVSAGAVFASGVVLDNPQRWAGLGMLIGNVAFDAGMPHEDGRLAGLPVFLAHGADDDVMDASRMERTWTWLTGDSGATTTARHDPVGHEISTPAVRALSTWLATVLSDGPVSAASSHPS